MHNMDRILNEDIGQEYGYLNEGEMHPEFGSAHEYAHEGEGEWEWAGEGEGEWEGEWADEGEYGHELSHEQYEQMEYEMASELLAVTNEAELDQFFGKLVSRVGRGVSKFAKSNVGRSLIGGLKSVAKVGLPIAGKVVGGFFGGPIGGKIGSKLGSMAANLFELEMEGMSTEDREFEMARRVVRLSTTATKRAVTTARKNPGAPPRAIAANAIKQAAAQHIPRLLKPISGGTTRPPINSKIPPYDRGVFAPHYPYNNPWNAAASAAMSGSAFGQAMGNAFGGQFGNPYGGQFGNPYGGQFGNPYGGQFANPYGGQFASNPYGGGAAAGSPPAGNSGGGDPYANSGGGGAVADAPSGEPNSGTWTRQGNQIIINL